MFPLLQLVLWLLRFQGMYFVLLRYITCLKVNGTWNILLMLSWTWSGFSYLSCYNIISALDSPPPPPPPSITPSTTPQVTAKLGPSFDQDVDEGGSSDSSAG